MRAVRRCSIPLVTLVLAFAGLVGTASADDLSVLQAVQKQASKLAGDHDFQKLQTLHVHNAGEAHRAVPPLQRIVRELRSAARAVDGTSGSTKAGRAGKTDWVAGTRTLAYGYGKLVESCKDLEAHRVGASNSAAYTAVRNFRKANKTIAKARRELRTAQKGLGL